MIGTVTAVRADAIDVKADDNTSVSAGISPETLLARVAPGEKTLQNAQPIKLAQIGVGDRVLVSFKPGTADARRIVVMAASDIAKRNDTDRADWARRGLFGVVASKAGNAVKLRMRTFQGEQEATVTVTDKTAFRRYAPDSVKFADAKPSSLAEVSAGDQLRARGQKSEDGLTVEAEEVVFGTFVTKAGSVLSVDPAASEVTIKDLANNKPLTVKLTADSQLKQMPNLEGMMRPGGPTGGQPPSAGGPPQGGLRPSSAAAAAGSGGGRPGGARDISQMLERMPAAKLGDLKPGETIVVSSTKGAKGDRITAIMLLSNAEGFVRMASAQSARNRDTMSAMGPQTLGLGGFGTGGGGFDLPGMIP